MYFSLLSPRIYIMASSFVFLWDLCMCEWVGLCISICFLCLFPGLFSFCLFSPILMCCYPLEAWLFSSERKRGVGSRWEQRCEELGGMGRGVENLNQDIVCEANYFQKTKTGKKPTTLKPNHSCSSFLWGYWLPWKEFCEDISLVAKRREITFAINYSWAKLTTCEDQL